MPRHPSRKNENILIMSSILVDAMPSYCCWIHNRCPTKNTELLPNILLIVSCSWLVLIRNCVPLVYNNEATFAFLLYPFCNLAILKKLQKQWVHKIIHGNKKIFLRSQVREAWAHPNFVCLVAFMYILCVKLRLSHHKFLVWKKKKSVQKNLKAKSPKKSLSQKHKLSLQIV